MFKLHIAVTRASIDALKLDLAKNLPDVKSAHRCEALARALGFRTYAAVRAVTARMAVAERQEADGVAFATYLAKHNFKVDTTIFYHAISRIAINEVLSREPLLNTHGYGAGDWERKNGVRETSDDRARRLNAGRADFANDYYAEQFLCALAFVSRIAPIKQNNRKAHSYNLKHRAERMASTYPDGRPLGPNYVSNGTLIVAAVYAGFRFRTHERSGGNLSLNVSFNMSTRSLADLAVKRAE